MVTITQKEADARRVKRSDYVSCTVAFIDCKKPGSHLKENYSIIGPGVTSSAEQVINLPEAHGFNIGAAAMLRCLIPRFDGAILSMEWKEALWDKFVTGAPRTLDRQGICKMPERGRTPSEQQYSDRKLRSRS